MLDIFWIILIIFLFYYGVKFSIKLKFKNYNFKNISSSFSRGKKGLFLTLGTKIGVGSIIGTTASIYIGGFGSVLWMWIFTFITSSMIYYESIFGTKFKRKLGKEYIGGPFFYIRYGLDKKVLAIIVTVLLIITYSFLFQLVQVNTIASLVMINTNMSIVILSIIILILLILTVFFSLKELLNLLNKIVPLMCIFFIALGLIAVIKNFYLVNNIFKLIISEALSLNGILAGSLIGIKRSIFLTELLIGTTSISSSVDECDENISASSQVLGSYFITYIVSALTAFMIIIFSLNNKGIFIDYTYLINDVFLFHFGNIGGLFLIILVTLFAVTTIISGFYIGLSNISYITNNKIIVLFFKISMVLFSMSGLYLSTTNIWRFLDIVMPILITINIFSIVKLNKTK